MPEISAVIPTYNRATIVTSAIDSVLNQTCRDFELIVVDDGSTDDTREVLKAYGPAVRTIRQANSGVSSAINAGIAAARGNWIGILGSDDEWSPKYFEWQMARITQYPAAVAHITNSITIHPDQHSDDHFETTRLTSLLDGQTCRIFARPLSTVIRHSPWFVQASLLRRDILIAAGLFDSSLTIGEDLDVLARMALLGPFSVANKPLVHIFRRAEATDHVSKIVTTKGLYSCESLYRVFAQLRRRDHLSPAEKKALDRALSANRRAIANLFLKSGRLQEARDSYRYAMNLHPSAKSILKYLISFLPAGLAIRSIRKGQDIQP